MSNVFNRVGGLKPRRNAFDLSYRKNFTCDMGELIPILCDEVIPGDHIKLGNEIVIRFQPLSAPVMHEITATAHYFFVPYRILWPDWENFISQGTLNGDPLPIQLPRYNAAYATNRTAFSLWDFFGMPLYATNTFFPQSAWPLAFPWMAYNRIYNEYYRDQDLQPDPVNEANNAVLRRNWRKDYFTAARPFRQKGTAPGLPINFDYAPGQGFPGADFVPLRDWVNPATTSTQSDSVFGAQGASAAVSGAMSMFNYGPQPTNAVPGSAPLTRRFGVDSSVVLKNILSEGATHLTTSTFDVADLRLAFQTQKWLERNARAGTRYTEFLRSHFGVSPTDARLDRPEYIGGTKQPIIVSEVLQTSQTVRDGNNPAALATMGGHGLAAAGQHAGNYNVQEYGLVMALLSVMPKPSYQDGMNRQWLRRIPTDFYFPEFSHLSEQMIERQEIFWEPVSPQEPFGYTGQYDEMRVKHDMVCSEMRRLGKFGTSPGGFKYPDLSYWNLTRSFGWDEQGDVGVVPALNSDFITCNPSKRIFNVQNYRGLIVNVQNNFMAVRPLPLIADPGLVDHF